MMQSHLTRTFIENRWYQRNPVTATWQSVVAAEEQPLDQQIAEWVRSTGAHIIHPGQLGIHTQWHDAEYRLKCITLGLTVLYLAQEASNEPTTPWEAPVPFVDDTDDPRPDIPTLGPGYVNVGALTALGGESPSEPE